MYEDEGLDHYIEMMCEDAQESADYGREDEEDYEDEEDEEEETEFPYGDEDFYGDEG